MGKSLRLGRVFGIPVEINITWVVVFLLLTFLLVNRFDASSLRWPVAQQWAVAVITVVLFFLSVLAHELSHSLVALSRGIHVESITLFIFGGVSRLAREPERPWEEFLVAVVGPLTSIALAAVAGGIWFGLGRGNSAVEMVALLVAWGNLSVGLFNLVPRLPSGRRTGVARRPLGRLRQLPAGHADCGPLRPGRGAADDCGRHRVRLEG